MTVGAFNKLGTSNCSYVYKLKSDRTNISVSRESVALLEKAAYQLGLKELWGEC